MQEKAPKKRKSGKSNWVKWAEKRNNNGGAKGVAEEMEIQEEEKVLTGCGAASFIWGGSGGVGVGA